MSSSSVRKRRRFTLALGAASFALFMGAYGLVSRVGIPSSTAATTSNQPAVTSRQSSSESTESSNSFSDDQSSSAAPAPQPNTQVQPAPAPVFHTTTRGS